MGLEWDFSRPAGLRCWRLGWMGGGGIRKIYDRDALKSKLTIIAHWSVKKMRKGDAATLFFSHPVPLAVRSHLVWPVGRYCWLKTKHLWWSLECRWEFYLWKTKRTTFPPASSQSWHQKENFLKLLLYEYSCCYWNNGGNGSGNCGNDDNSNENGN